MPLDAAKSAVACFLSHKPERAVIGFYGGEPLLEFELMKDVIAFAEPLAAIMVLNCDSTLQPTALCYRRKRFIT